MSEIDVVVEKDDIGNFVKLMSEDLRYDYKITALGRDMYRVVVTPRELSLYERFRVWRAERKRRYI
jgi:hypothetical protein